MGGVVVVASLASFLGMRFLINRKAKSASKKSSSNTPPISDSDEMPTPNTPNSARNVNTQSGFMDS
jgi:hypothetical protein